MNTASYHKRVRPTEIAVYLQTLILGFLIGELWYLTQVVASILNVYIKASDKQIHALIACAISICICIAYFYSREGYSHIKRLVQSYRFDLLTLLILGILISVSVGGVGTKIYQEYISKIYIVQLMLIVAIPVAIALIVMLKAVTVQTKSTSTIPFFINDQDLKTKTDDLLGLSSSAERFAERVLNGDSSDSLVFGIDAPWGIGKSSFINFCCEYWQEKRGSKIIVHRFEPLRYEDNADLASKFVDDLVNTIQKHAFIPSIRPLFSKYSRLIKGTSDFSFFGLRFEPSPKTVEETLENLESLLSSLNWKIIIVVDDLDRLNWSSIKHVLFAIKRSFMLSNVSYVLCYDTENIVSTGNIADDAEKVREFLEKFVNVKISLFLDSSALAKYVSSNFASAVKNNLQIDPRTLDEIKDAIQELVNICNSDRFIFYQAFLGDVRKLKRLINTMLLFEIEKTDFKDNDFNKEDLIHLLLVYVNYPNIFRKIYNTETDGKGGFFSLKSYYKDNNTQFKNSEEYIAYVKTLNENQSFLLSKIFNLDIADSKSIKGINESDKRSRACFNDSSSRNLERYLNLIVKLSKPEKRAGYKFYLNNKDELLTGVSFEMIFAKDEFSFSEGDFSRYELWRVCVNSATEFEPVQASNAVLYLMAQLPDCSRLYGEKIGINSRVKLIYSLIKLLDSAAWGSSRNGRRNNSVDNISEIANWIFGEGQHQHFGVLNTLAKADRGPLGLADLMLFRLYCSADRNISFFNLQRALSLHGDPGAPISGPTVEIAKEGMREISQSVIKIFKDQYIVPKKNIFVEINNLSFDDFAGKSAGFVRAQISSGEVKQEQIDAIIYNDKADCLTFIIYQLGNSHISSGVGCGFYDETGKKDEKGIATLINDYLFNVCFNPFIRQENFELFLDYLLINFSHSYKYEGSTYIPSLAEFTKILSKEHLKEYWLTHREAILSQDFILRKRQIFTSGYVCTYSDDLPATFKVLDELIDEPVSAAPVVPI